MPNYDFHALLEPLEFQDLVCDIIQLRDNIFIETYKEGRDSGIDGLYTDSNKRTIVQAKRYQQNFNRLYHDLQDIELPKVRKLKPDRYILGVSIDFRPGEKEKIIELFEGYITSSGDILSRRDINQLLKDPAYKRIELAYPKLWLPSITIFEKTLKESVHRASYKESAEELKEAIKTSKAFVPTKVYHKALNNWSQNHVIILSGEPGVGKTTIAYLLALAYLQPDNLDGFIWANSMRDVYTMLEDEQKQVIILDDFWGSIFHDDRTRRNDENQLDKLIRRIVESKGKKRLILTTREYILQQGLQKHPALKETLERYALICTMEEYSDAEKASIFFQHLYASNLEYEYVDYLYTHCDWIIHHRNYNPRVLTLFLRKEPDKDCSPEYYFEELCDYFDNPGAFWKSIFVELSQEAQMVAMLLLISSTPMSLTDMNYCYEKYIHDCINQPKVKNLIDCISELEETMLKSFYSEDEETILLKFNMPAVQDFLFMHIEENSEQYVPVILRCCAFYNQLQFLLEHLSMSCSSKVADLIVQQSMLHYQDYGDSYMEYDGSWNWDMDTFFDERGYLNRFFDLIRCCNPEKHPALGHFLEKQIKDYCLTMGKGDLEAQYADLHNLPDIIVRCINKGISFSGKDIIDKYYKEAFSVYHYLAMKKFQEVFPEEYGVFHKAYFPQIKSELKDTILSELELLDDLCMDFEFDILFDDIPNIIKEFGLRYTKEFRKKILLLYGREPESVNRKKVINEKSSNDYIDQKEQALEAIKEDAGNWLLGPSETYLEYEDVVEIISKSNLNLAMKAELEKILESQIPYYVYKFLQTKESIELLCRVLYDSGSSIPDQESFLYMMMIWHIGRKNQELIKNLIGFCAESFLMIMYQEEPVLRINQFLSSEVYEAYLKNDDQLNEVVFENLIIKDEQWVRFLYIPLFILCNASIMHMGCKNEELETYYQDLWGENFSKLIHIVKHSRGYDTSVYYADIGSYRFKNYEWEGCMYRIFEELDPFHFNKVYVQQKIKSYLDSLGNGDYNSKILKHVSLCRIECEYVEDGTPGCLNCEICDELCMIDNLSLAEGWNPFPKQITKSKLKELEKDKKICKKEDDKWEILFYEIKDIELLKEFGIYNDVLSFVKELESIYLRFVNGDYSQIERVY